MPEKHKVAIIGAGPIGLYLAWKLSEAGHQITVFEKKPDIEDLGLKACSGLISERLRKFAPLNESVIENRINVCNLRFPKKTVALNIKPTHLVIERVKLIETLFDLCQKAGANVLFGQEIKSLPPGFDKVIACDGALSRIRESIWVEQGRKGIKGEKVEGGEKGKEGRGLKMRMGVQVFEEKAIGQEDFGEKVDVWPFEGGFCWRIPGGHQVEYGALGPLRTTQKEFESFLRKKDLAYLLGQRPRAALIPQGLCLPYLENITLCGDAAGLTKPWSGGGIIWGMTAADILVKYFPDFQKYKQETERVFKWPLLKAKLAIPLAYFLGNYLPWLLPSRISMDNDILKI